MRLLRSRRRDGAICVSVEVFGYEIAEMAKRGLLDAQRLHDRDAVTKAFGTSWRGGS
jgi:hypothetical protein